MAAFGNKEIDFSKEHWKVCCRVTFFILTQRCLSCSSYLQNAQMIDLCGIFNTICSPSFAIVVVINQYQYSIQNTVTENLILQIRLQVLPHVLLCSDLHLAQSWHYTQFWQSNSLLRCCPMHCRLKINTRSHLNRFQNLPFPMSITKYLQLLSNVL